MKLFKNIFKLKPKRFLGIDLGSTSFRMVELRRRGKKIWLENYVETDPVFFEDTIKNIKEDNSLYFEKSVAKKIKESCKIAKISTKNLNIAIPDFYTFYATFDLPNMATEEIIQAVQYEVRPHIPLPISDITLDWTIIEGEPSKTPLKVLVVAIPNEIIFQYKNIANLAGLKLRFLEPEVSSLSRSLIGQEDKKSIVGIIDMGAKSTTCSVIDNGMLKSSHSFKIGGIEFTSMLAKSFNISYNEAEQMKIEYGLSKDDSIKKNILGLVDSCIVEIEKVFRDYERIEGKEIQKIIIFGKTSLINGLKEYLSEKLKKEINFADPFKNIFCSEELKKISQERKMSLAIPIGVAMKGFQ